MSPPSFFCKDSTGRSHSFGVSEHSARWNDLPGVYMFITNGSLLAPPRVLYVGQTVSFRDRIPTHERWHEARALGARWVASTTVHNKLLLSWLERDLIEQFQPALNVVHKRPPPNGLLSLFGNN